jgi:hypothetical protein
MTGITVSIWHNVARDQAGRHTAPLDGFTPGDPMVRVFTYQATPRGRSPEAIAEDAFALANGHPRDAGTARLSRLYYQRRLRSLSFPGKSPVLLRVVRYEHRTSLQMDIGHRTRLSRNCSAMLTMTRRCSW